MVTNESLLNISYRTFTSSLNPTTVLMQADFWPTSFDFTQTNAAIHFFLYVRAKKSEKY